MDRIKYRSRDGESNIKKDYLEKLDFFNRRLYCGTEVGGEVHLLENLDVEMSATYVQAMIEKIMAR